MSENNPKGYTQRTKYYTGSGEVKRVNEMGVGKDMGVEWEGKKKEKNTLFINYI
jgi:hypothetical protein